MIETLMRLVLTTVLLEIALVCVGVMVTPPSRYWNAEQKRRSDRTLLICSLACVASCVGATWVFVGIWT